MPISEFALPSLFKIKSGDYHAANELDAGDIPLISCGEFNNGLVGYFDIPPNYQYDHAITIAYNGQPLTAKYHPHSFAAKDDVAVLLPLKSFKEKTLIFIAAQIAHQKWRYSYGRKCFKGKVTELIVSLPVDESGEIDQKLIEQLIPSISTVMPRIKKIVKKKDEKIIGDFGNIEWKQSNLIEYFTLDRGDFHSLTALAKGKFPTVSRVSEDNGIVGYFEKPEDAKIYPSGTMTVSTVSGDAFVQLNEFIATDNVILCVPKMKLRMTTIFFFQMMINREKWRYSYGRQCYRTKLGEMRIYLPMKKDGTLDEDFMQSVIESPAHWQILEERLEL